MSRIKRPFLLNRDYFITSVTHKRKHWFTNPEFAQIVVDQLKHYEALYSFDLKVYCVLPDHYHAVLNVGENKTISQIIHAVHSYTSTLINKRLGHAKKTKIWKGYFWDEVIRDEDMYWKKVSYTLFNPWRAGIVKNPLVPYQFSSIGEWLDREGEEFIVSLFARYKRWYE